MIAGLCIAALVLLVACVVVSRPTTRDASLLIAFLALSCVAVALLWLVATVDLNRLPHR